VFQTPPKETARAVETALAAGYRHIDTAASYGNEREVGEGIRRSGVNRREVFVETKVWISDYGYEATLHAFDKSAGKLGVEQIDLLILHQPLPTAFDRTIGAYKALETLLAEGKVRAIGVANFLPEYLESLLEQAEVLPAVNQIEVHPYFTQTPSREWHSRHGILTQAWSPMGGITSYRQALPQSTFENPTILDIAQAHGTSAAQVMLRWHFQQGRSAIPKSARPERIVQNFDHLRLRAQHRGSRSHRRARHRRTGRPGTGRRQPGELRQGDPRGVNDPPTRSALSHVVRRFVNVHASLSPATNVTSSCVVPSTAGPGRPFSVQAIEVA
jgi:2,5-diketo-D-gluconate reductase A